MIKIIKGTFGLQKDNGIVRITDKEDPISIDPEREAELIELGVAVKVEETDLTPDDSFEVSEEYLKGLKLPELKEFAAQFGIKFEVGTKKEKFVQQILDFLEVEAALEDEMLAEASDIPDFNPEDAVR